MNGNWSDYRINQLHRENTMREAEKHRLGQLAEGKNNPVSYRLAAMLASVLAIIG